MKGIHRAAVLGLALGATTLLGGLIEPRPAATGEVRIDALGGAFNVPVTGLRERRFQGIIRQQYDFSCGSAALASLLTYHYDRPKTEQEVFLAMWNVGDQERIRRGGFSLLDMKTYLATLGLGSDGFRVPLDKLAEAGVPVITLIDVKGYKHFVLVKGIDDDRVLVGDPALGVKEFSRAEFQEMWSGIVFVIHNDMDVARQRFNEPSLWEINGDAPTGAARFRNSLGTRTLNMPGRNEVFR